MTKTLQLGAVVITRGLKAHMDEHHISPWPFLNRHRKRDWGLVDRDDAKANDHAAEAGERVISKYLIQETGQFIWVITEWDRSVTTLLTPDEY